MRTVIIKSDEAVVFASKVLLLLNERGFAVDNTKQALQCIDEMTIEILLRDTCAAEEEFSRTSTS